MSHDELQARVERLEAAEAVRALLWRYATTMDRLAPAEELADLFTEDVVLETGSRHEGREAVLAYYVGVLSTLTAARHHVVTTTVEVQGPGRARHRGYFLALLDRRGEIRMVYGDYDDVVVRGHDGRWRFERKGNRGAGSILIQAAGEGEA